MKASLEVVKSVKVPNETKTYIPVPNSYLIDEIKKHLLSKSMTLQSESYELSKNGDRMFGTIQVGEEHSQIVKTLGFRNSYDKSIPIGLACGGTVIVCSNLMFKGDLVIVRKHTGNVFEEINGLIQKAVLNLGPTFDSITNDYQCMKKKLITDRQAGQVVGEMLFMGKILEGHVKVIQSEWRNTYKGKSAWDLCQCLTESMKYYNSIGKVMDRTTDSYNYLIKTLNLN